MAREALSGLMAALRTDESLRREFLAAESFEAAAAVSTRHGWAIKGPDLEALAQNAAGSPGQLSEAELEGVSGGSKLFDMWSVLKNILEKYDESAKKVIQSIGR